MEYRITIPDAIAEEFGDWQRVEAIKLVIDGDRVDIMLTTNLAAAKRFESGPRLAPVEDSPINFRWR